MIRLGEVSRPVLDLLERYSPEFPCFLKVMTDTAPILNDTFRDGALHINLELITNQPTPYQPNELPKYEDKRGPTCVGKNYSHPGEKPGPYTQDNPAPYITGEDGVIGDHNKTDPLPAEPAAEPLGARVRAGHRRRRYAGRAEGDRLDRRPGDGHPGERRTGSGHPDDRPAGPRRAGEPQVKLLDKKTSIDTVRLAIFVVVTTIATALLAVTIGNISFNATTKYRAVFTDVVGLNKGDDIRIAGVRVGQVDKIAIYQDTFAMVTFSVDSDQVVDTSTQATMRYRNLVGNRYIALTEGVGGGTRMKSNGLIDKDRTAPALDLSVLFNGFKPLFTALTPADVNQFAFEVIKVLQGEGGTIESLLARTASLTTTLADADQVIGDLITNLTSTLQIVSQRQQNFSAAAGQPAEVHHRAEPGHQPDPRFARLDQLAEHQDGRPAAADPGAGEGGPGPAPAGRHHPGRHPGDLGQDAAVHAREAEHDDPDRVVRVLVQLLPLRFRRQRDAAPGDPHPGLLRQQLGEVSAPVRYPI